jgi:hypothetical protein
MLSCMGAAPREEKSNEVAKAEAIKAPVQIDCSPNGVDGEVAADMLLNDWKEGTNDDDDWTFSASRSRLFAVSSFKKLTVYRNTSPPRPKMSNKVLIRLPASVKTDGDTFAYVYRIQSSTQGGFPITADWGVNVIRMGNLCRVASVQRW